MGGSRLFSEKMAYGVIVSCLCAQARHRSFKRINDLEGTDPRITDQGVNRLGALASRVRVSTQQVRRRKAAFPASVTTPATSATVVRAEGRQGGDTN